MIRQSLFRVLDVGLKKFIKSLRPSWKLRILITNSIGSIGKVFVISTTHNIVINSTCIGLADY